MAVSMLINHRRVIFTTPRQHLMYILALNEVCYFLGFLSSPYLMFFLCPSPKTNHSDKLLKNGHPEGPFATWRPQLSSLRRTSRHGDVANGRLPMFNEQDISGDGETKAKDSHSRNGGIPSAHIFPSSHRIFGATNNACGWRPSNELSHHLSSQ